MNSDPFAIPEDRLAPWQPPRRPRFTVFTLLSLLAIVVVLLALFTPFTRGLGTREAARRTQCKNNLKQIAVALHNYLEDYHALPPAYTVAADGTPLHSWRTLILPYLEQQKLYDSIDLSKPWDDAANSDARDADLQIFRCPSADLPPSCTVYMAMVAANGCFRPGEPRVLSEITDDPGSTLMVIEVPSNSAVHWMAPVDADEGMVLGITADSTLQHTGGIQAGLVDGSVRFLSVNLPAKVRLALISIAGNETEFEF